MIAKCPIADFHSRAAFQWHLARSIARKRIFIQYGVVVWEVPFGLRTLRSCEFNDSIALVVYSSRRISFG
jgi:hypothetical protein